MKDSLLVVTDGLIANQDVLRLHPDLFSWQSPLLKRKQQWFKFSKHNPLSLYAALLQTDSATLLTSKMTLSPAKQYWLASPYHAQLTRDSVRVVPEGTFPWSEEDARYMCDTFNPWLKDEGMSLNVIGAALLLSCDRVWDVHPLDFPSISGATLPNHHPQGTDGGRWMRLQSEIQMLLHQTPLPHRRQRGDIDVHGLWFWGKRQKDMDVQQKLPVATRNTWLQSVAEATDAHLIITEANKLSLLLRDGSDLPKHIVLLGEGYMLHLETEFWHQFRQHECLPPHDIDAESKGLQLLQHLTSTLS